MGGKYMQAPIDVQDPEPEHDTTTETDLERQQLEMHLRDSVIGRYIRNYNKRLRTLSQELEQTRQQVDDKIRDIEKRFAQGITEVKADIRNLSAKLEDDNSGLTLDKIDALVGARIDVRLDGITGRDEADLQKLSTLINEFASEFQTQIDRISNETKLLREQARRSQESLRADLASETEALETTKVDRIALSETLIALGVKLKEDNLLDELDTDLTLDDVLEGSEES
jgi:Skp family chaperone for outer membrane proteins